MSINTLSLTIFCMLCHRALNIGAKILRDGAFAHAVLAVCVICFYPFSRHDRRVIVQLCRVFKAIYCIIPLSLLDILRLFVKHVILDVLN